MTRNRIDHDRVRALGAEGKTGPEIAALVGCHPRYAYLILQGKIVLGRSLVQSRMMPERIGAKVARMPPLSDEAVAAGRSRFHRAVTPPEHGERVLKSGYNNAKLGSVITKGRWAGFPIYSLTLEERATCPTSCRHWRSCYGNGMHLARRFEAGPVLEARIESEARALARDHPRGFAVRLHALGDFYSVAYVDLWRDLLDNLAPLRCFGFTARWDGSADPIAAALVDLVSKRWSRFAIRFSNAPAHLLDGCSTISIEHPIQKPADAIICPQQEGKTQACATCALCWQSTRRIAFVQH